MQRSLKSILTFNFFIIIIIIKKKVGTSIPYYCLHYLVEILTRD